MRCCGPSRPPSLHLELPPPQPSPTPAHSLGNNGSDNIGNFNNGSANVGDFNLGSGAWVTGRRQRAAWSARSPRCHAGCAGLGGANPPSAWHRAPLNRLPPLPARSQRGFPEHRVCRCRLLPGLLRLQGCRVLQPVSPRSPAGRHQTPRVCRAAPEGPGACNIPSPDSIPDLSCCAAVIVPPFRDCDCRTTARRCRATSTPTPLIHSLPAHAMHACPPRRPAPAGTLSAWGGRRSRLTAR